MATGFTHPKPHVVFVLYYSFRRISKDILDKMHKQIFCADCPERGIQQRGKPALYL
jgi:hypothetical protein